MTDPLTPVRRRLAAVRADGDRGSLVLAMLVTLVATMVAALVLPLFLNSANAARFDDRRARQLAAAQSGVDATLARIRSGSGTTVGVRALLPCTPIIGTVLSVGTLRYRATVEYFKDDPRTTSDARPLTCIAGAGTQTAPAYARITAVGTDVAGTSWTGVAARTVTATYVLRTTSPNVSGGNMRVTIAKNGATTLLCVDAGSAPTVGTVLRTAACNSAAPSQLFAYTSDLTLVLTASRTAARPAGLCVSSPPGTTQVPGGAISLQPCAPTATQQQWSFNTTTQWEGTNDGRSVDGLVIHPASDAAGSSLGLRWSWEVANTYRWDPDSRIGAGAAGPARHNLVNYGQFGRCLDLHNFQVAWPYMISWPCKQTPDANEPSNWNQRWYWTDPGANGPVAAAVYAVAGTNVEPGSAAGGTFCVTDPGTVGGYVTTPACSPTAPAANQKWRVIGSTGSSYATSYRIESTDGRRCLAVKDPSAGDYADLGVNISKIVVQTCSDSPYQKWNAPPDASAARVIDQNEN